LINEIPVASAFVDTALPAVVGAVVGGLIAHFSARARGHEEHQRTLDLLVVQDERRAASAMLESIQQIVVEINSGTMPDAGQLHNRWSDQVLAPSRVIRDDELRERARAGAYAIFLATVADDQYTRYAILRGAVDVQEWLEAWLTRETPPKAHLPTSDEIADLVWDEGG
jgi:hypothetical protein